mgnify:CR=1 FL=1
MTKSNKAQTSTPSTISDNAMSEDDSFNIPERAAPPEIQSQEKAETLPSVAQVAGNVKSGHNFIDMSAYGLSDPFAETVNASYKGGAPLAFEAPKPRPGFVQRWVRFENENGSKDLKNIGKKIRQMGWKPRRASTVQGNNPAPVMDVDGGGIMMTQGFILCEMPEEKAEQLRESYEHETHRQNISTRAELSNQADKDRTSVVYDSKEDVDVGRKVKTVSAADNE